MALKNLINELHRRSIWQVLAGYGLFTWLLFETFELLRVGVGLPSWVEPTAAILLIVLLPALLATASIQRGRPARWPRVVLGDDAGEDSPTPGPAPASGAASGGSGEPGGAAPEAGPRERPAGGRRGPFSAQAFLTWRNTLLGGLGAFALLALVTAIYMILRTAGIGPAGTLVAQGTLDEREELILADFQGDEDMAEVARAITEGLRVDLAQSPVVRLHSQRAVSAALSRMELEPDAALDLELAREVAVREAIRAVVGGEIQRVGSRYVITAHVISSDDGSSLVSRRATARDVEDIVHAVDELSKSLRERIGEPLGSIGRAEPLEQVTTADLEALRRYSSGVRAIDVEGAPDRGIALLEEAIALDSSFAMAWRKLGVALGNRAEERRRIVEALTEAYTHRDRLSGRERDLAVASYETNVTGNLGAARAAYEALLQREPEHDIALNNLGDLFMRLRDFESARPLFERALEIDPEDVIPFQNMVLTRANLGDFDGALALEAEHPALLRDPTVREHLAGGWAARGAYEEARRRLLELRDDEVTSPFWQRQTGAELGALAAVRGRVEESERWYRGAMESAARDDLARQALVYATRLARIETWLLRDPDGALSTLDEALAAHPLDDLPALDRPSLEIAVALAEAGRPDRARALIEGFEADVEASLRGREQRALLERARGAVALAAGRFDEAIERTRASDEGICILCALPQLAEAYERAGQPDSAMAIYERYLETPYLWRVRDTDGWFRARAHERLAALLSAAGDTDAAVGHLAALERLWDGADAPLTTRLEALRLLLRRELPARS